MKRCTWSKNRVLALSLAILVSTPAAFGQGTQSAPASNSQTSEVCTPLDEPRIVGESIVWYTCAPRIAPQPPNRNKDSADDIFANALSKSPEQLQAEIASANAQVAAPSPSGSGGDDTFAKGIGAILGGIVLGRTGNAELATGIMALMGNDAETSREAIQEAQSGRGRSSSGDAGTSVGVAQTTSCHQVDGALVARLRNIQQQFRGGGAAAVCQMSNAFIAAHQDAIPAAQQCDKSGGMVRALQQSIQQYVPTCRSSCRATNMPCRY